MLDLASDQVRPNGQAPKMAWCQKTALLVGIAVYLVQGPSHPPPSLFGIGGQKLLFESWQPSNADSSLYSSPFSHPSHAWLLACTI